MTYSGRIDEQWYAVWVKLDVFWRIQGGLTYNGTLIELNLTYFDVFREDWRTTVLCNWVKLDVFWRIQGGLTYNSTLIELNLTYFDVFREDWRTMVRSVKDNLMETGPGTVKAATYIRYRVVTTKSRNTLTSRLSMKDPAVKSSPFCQPSIPWRRHRHGLIDWLIDCLIDWLIDWRPCCNKWSVLSPLNFLMKTQSRIDWLIDWYWLIDWLTDQKDTIIDWLTDQKDTIIDLLIDR